MLLGEMMAGSDVGDRRKKQLPSISFRPQSLGPHGLWGHSAECSAYLAVPKDTGTLPRTVSAVRSGYRDDLETFGQG